MHPPITTVMFLAVVAALAGNGLAQNDECTGAILVVQGANGPYSNSGSTTSFAWPCGTGGNDVWFLYVAPGAGSLTVDTCGGAYDSTIELFDGNLGCGSLSSLGCNDDTCGLQSSMTATVNLGDAIYIRVGGYSSATGTFPLNVNGPSGSGSVATATAYGTGCYKNFASFYELFPDMTLFDLSNTALTMLPTGTGYTVIPGITAYVPPSPAAVPLALGDDAEASVNLTQPFPCDGGATSTLAVCSNGFVAVGSGNYILYDAYLGDLLDGSQTAWWIWQDLDTSTPGSGQVMFEEIGGIAYITFDGVYNYGGTSAADANTFQFQFDTASGIVHMVTQTISTLNYSTAMFGYSPGGTSPDPTASDLSATLPNTFSLSSRANESNGLQLSAAGRPVLGNTLSLDTGSIPTGTAIGALLLGFGQINPGFDLSVIGMPGCFQYAMLNAKLLFLVNGASGSVPLGMPNIPAFAGMHVYAQSITFTSGVNAFNMLSSNGLDLHLGTL